MIAEIRNYIKTQIKTVSTNYSEASNPFFNDAEVIETKANYTYHARFGNTEKAINDLGEEISRVNVTLRTYRQGGNDKLGTFDEGYCEAILIGSLLLDKSKYINAQYIINVDSLGVTPSEVVDSQDIYVFENNLIFTLSYGLGE